MLNGIDISSYQPHYDLRKVADEGNAFVGIKATEGLGTSNTFAKQWDAAESTPLYQFAYHFHRWEKDNAAEQARHMRDVVGPWEPGLLPPASDLEWIKGSDGNYIHLPAKTIAVRARALLEGLEDGFNRLPTLYIPVAFWHDYLCVEGKPIPEALYLTRWLLWAAGGPADKKIPNPMTGAPDWKWTFRQTSGHGRSAGIFDSLGHPVDVDTDTYAGSLDDLKALAGIPA